MVQLLRLLGARARRGGLGVSFPPVAELLPQSGPMRLLSEVLAHEAGETRCALEVRRAELFADATGRVPAWVALEWLAQCVAAHAGLEARARGERPRAGLLLGTRRLVLRAERFSPGARLVAVARPLRAASSGAGAFACRLEEPGARAGTPALAEGTLTVYAPEGLERAGAEGGGALGLGVGGSRVGAAGPARAGAAGEEVP